MTAELRTGRRSAAAGLSCSWPAGAGSASAGGFSREPAATLGSASVSLKNLDLTNSDDPGDPRSLDVSRGRSCVLQTVEDNERKY